ncbi:FliA/WhiG family RNA polymerase sigma factor [Desulfopila aestuarii]|uniref:RNA polymerase, sigma 28 subunit, SigD/FliA/WhiG n=1 Tax=Desulfopila aestuarii DSM 18488 TaxID=1121416 RepID=A0A1M7YDN9_9BACT|nr:FliA/WhiG family RNA polymerase sigma factor [Desulfopila aestuarii]SHO50745.1 RNA polymerase, sigma 28 subunit, SigD/FliA/WhiG [Desulfopila aestuarii DSM 18488]
MLYNQPPMVDDRSRLIQENLYLVDILVGRMVTQVPSFMNKDDMRSAGMVGLLDAANKFDASKNIMFKTFAEHRIRGAILDEMRKLDWFSRSLRDKHNRIARTIHDLELRLGRDPEEEEIAAAMEMSLHQYQLMLGEVSHLGCVSLNETLDHSDEGQSFLDSLTEDKVGMQPGHRLEATELTQVIAQVLEQLSEKERLVISLYYYEELTQKEIADILELSEGRVSQLHSQALIKLKTKVQSRLD